MEVNCGAAAPGLIQSELFGHARAHSPARTRARRGLFEEANRRHPSSWTRWPSSPGIPGQASHRTRAAKGAPGGGEPRTGRRRPGGGRHHADPQLAVRQGRFREDLFYRLNVISLTVSPLRQRRDDVLPLAQRFLADLARETNRKVSGFSPAAEEVLLAYGWPGNVRELRNVVERSLLLKQQGDLVEVEELPVGPSARRAEASEGASPGPPSRSDPALREAPHPRRLEPAERRGLPGRADASHLANQPPQQDAEAWVDEKRHE